MSIAEGLKLIAQAQAALRPILELGITPCPPVDALEAAMNLDRALQLLYKYERGGEDDEEKRTPTTLIDHATMRVNVGFLALRRGGCNDTAEPLGRWVASACGLNASGLDDSWPDNIKHGLPATKNVLDRASCALGFVLSDKGDHAGAKEVYERWVRLYRDKLHSPPPIPALRCLSEAYTKLGSDGAAARVRRQALKCMEADPKMGPHHPETIKMMVDVSNGLNSVPGKEQEAEELAKAAVSRLESNSDPALDRHRINAWCGLASIITVNYRAGDPSLNVAADYTSRAMVLARRLLEAAEADEARNTGQGYPRWITAAQDLEHAYKSHCTVMQFHDKWREGEKAARKALEINDMIIAKGGGESSRSECLVTRARSLSSLSVCLGGQGKFVEAEALAREAHSITDREVGPSRRETVATLCDLASLLHRIGKDDDAAPLFRRVIRLTEKDPGLGQYHAQNAREELAAIERRRSGPSSAAVADLLMGVRISNACAVCSKSKAEAEGGKLKNCAGCGIVSYCSAACQKADWKRGHKAACTAAREEKGSGVAAGAGAGASGSGGSARGKKKDKKDKKKGSGAAAEAEAGGAGAGAAMGEARRAGACAVCAQGPAEGAKLKGCSGCGLVSYCSAACQKADWKRGHKAACTAARAAKGDAAGGNAQG